EPVVASEALSGLDVVPDGDQSFVGDMQVLTSTPRRRNIERPAGRRSDYSQQRRGVSRFPARGMTRRCYSPADFTETIFPFRLEAGMERRRFIVKAGGVLAAAGAMAAIDAPNVIAQPKFQWRMSTTWTPALDHLQGAAQQLAKVVEEMSGGRFRIEVFQGGQIMQPLDCFDATSKGTVEAFMGTPTYWAEKEPA